MESISDLTRVKVRYSPHLRPCSPEPTGNPKEDVRGYVPKSSFRNIQEERRASLCENWNDPYAPCHYEGKYFTLGESWLRKDCFHCTCLHPVGVGCCDTSQHPIDFPAGCEVRQEAGTCQFSLVQKSDPRLPCKGGGPDPEWGSANTPVPAAPAPHSS
ncbi:hypothetical protein MJG53_003438 [Ovis ammon polii x Ovis aries]|uniref:Beta-microseminoprotein n=2 Tax=Ovis TaxID=9935 RepID=A0A836ACS9_SHEEP|nr:hypothetical protein JEQ12_009051 [Ovis aries]KAI4573553.1 hypothetical protein MJT46_004793 [Ovis ammon polii x Ovis aries]KAI4589030.1 hypothetical protein MJG53_003438 [Ovis ammon polii x Ovis aries]